MPKKQYRNALLAAGALAIGCSSASEPSSARRGVNGNAGANTEPGAPAGAMPTNTETGNATAAPIDAISEPPMCAAATSCPILRNVTLEDPPCRECDTCIAKNCCAEMTTCFTASGDGASECEQLFICIIGIGPDTCASTGACEVCERAHPTAVADYRALSSCLARNDDAGTGACKGVCRNL